MPLGLEYTAERFPEYFKDGVKAGFTPLVATEVAGWIGKAKGHELPLESIIAARQRVVRRLQQDWEAAAFACLNDAEAVFRDFMLDTFEAVKKDNSVPAELHNWAVETMHEAIWSKKQEAEARLQDCIDMEVGNKANLAFNFSMLQAELKREKKRLMEDLQAAISALPKEKAHDSSEEVLELVATAMAYWTFASQRFIDSVPMEIRHHLIVASMKGFEKARFAWTNLSTEEMLEKIQPSPEDKQKKKELEDKKAELEKLDELYKNTKNVAAAWLPEVNTPAVGRRKARGRWR